MRVIIPARTINSFAKENLNAHEDQARGLDVESVRVIHSDRQWTGLFDNLCNLGIRMQDVGRASEP